MKRLVAVLLFFAAATHAQVVLNGTSGPLGGLTLAAGGCATTVPGVSITGATTSMTVTVTPQTYPGDGFTWTGYVSAPNTVIVKVCALIAGYVGSSVYDVNVLTGSAGGGGSGGQGFGASFGSTTSGSPLLGVDTAYFVVPHSCTVAAWNITVNAGTATFDVWALVAGTAVPTSANSITASAQPAISTGTAIHSTTLTGWTTAIANNTIIAVNLKTVSGATYAALNIQCD